MNGWKVISLSRTYFNMQICNGNPACLNYPVGEWVYPKIKGSYLFFFKNKEDAERFLKGYATKGKMVPCIAKNCYKAKYMDAYGSIAKFWALKNRSDDSGSTEAPKGTWFAKSIMCLK